MPDRTLPEWLSYIEQLHAVAIDLGLTRVAAVAERLAVVAPAPLVMVIAGTNGKGSTAVFAEALLRQMGYRVGTTLSPHVHHFNERIRIDGQPASDAALCASFEAVEVARGEISLTYFEFAVLAALHRIRAERCDVAVLEVGLGGRLDAVNLVSGQVAVITSIGLDHQSFLGHDLEQIGREKAGIFRRGQQVVLGAPVTESVRTCARELDCAVTELGHDFTVANEPDGWRVSAPPGLGLLPWGQLAPQNSAVAICAVACLVGGAGLTRAVVRAAVREARLPGRCELLTDHGQPVVADVAHNPAGAAFLAAQLRQRYPNRRWHIILGMLADKDAAGVAAALDDIAATWLCVPTAGGRGQDAVQLAERIQSGPTADRQPRVCADVASAVRLALQPGWPFSGQGGAQDGILVCGSFAVVEAARDHLTTTHPPAAEQVSGSNN